ncbi:MAG: hypothetical protein ABFD47_15385 [Armatimonadota bacterium]
MRKKLVKTGIAAPKSRATALSNAAINPTPRLNNIIGITRIGSNRIHGLGTTLYTMQSTSAKTNCMRNERMELPTEAIIRDFFEKLIFEIIEPAFTKEFALVTNPTANNCHTDIPRIAYIG